MANIVTPFNTETSSTESTEFVKHLQNQIGDELVISEYPAAYESNNAKLRYLKAQSKGTRTGTTASPLRRPSKNAAADNTPKGAQQVNPDSVPQLREASNWHTMIAHIKAGQIAIYDPDYVPKTPDSQLSALANIKTIMAFVKELKG
ncbi:hypothetical protein FN846DRAFT_1021495 [Sphaerosporella brunnea]|uniref:Uncharacterized protein n=1 Tax=Sphaerosporella brunnea TaxID=1250544 RepID=A0A5J5EWW0_9PEZI|nr:hypothetical protein FN846DRAFT_1021495 [Sphaerosporella brunnea]